MPAGSQSVFFHDASGSVHPTTSRLRSSTRYYAAASTDSSKAVCSTALNSSASNVSSFHCRQNGRVRDYTQLVNHKYFCRHGENDCDTSGIGSMTTTHFSESSSATSFTKQRAAVFKKARELSSQSNADQVELSGSNDSGNGKRRSSDAPQHSNAQFSSLP